jgi:outer membrane protein
MVNIMNRILVLAAFLLASSAAMAQSQPVIGIVDLEQALFNSEAASQLESSTRAEFRNDEERLERLNAELRALIERAQRDESIMSEAELRNLNSDAQEKQVQMQVIAERLQGAWQQRQQAFVDSMRAFLSQALDTVIREGNYDIVLNAEALVHYSSARDITPLVTAKLNELAR